MVGTPRYVSPEYVETGYCDQRGDIYALGIIAYEMLAGEPAFAEGSSVSIMMQRFRTDPRVLVERLACFPAPIVQVVSKAITVDIEQRYQSANEFHTALSSLHDILPSS